MFQLCFNYVSIIIHEVNPYSGLIVILCAGTVISDKDISFLDTDVQMFLLKRYTVSAPTQKKPLEHPELT